MPKCEHCGKELDRLVAIVKEVNIYICSPMEFAEGLAGEADYRHIENSEFDVVQWKCPYCNEDVKVEGDVEVFFADSKPTDGPA